MNMKSWSVKFSSMAHSKTRGFTLIELMVVVAIIGVLAAIAYPSYQQWVTQSRRSDAHGALTRIANLQEKFLFECNTYAANLDGARACATGRLGYAPAAPVLSPEGDYVITLTAPTGACPITSCFVMVANPDAAGASGRQRGDGRLEIHSNGLKQWDKDNAGTWKKWTDK